MSTARVARLVHRHGAPCRSDAAAIRVVIVTDIEQGRAEWERRAAALEEGQARIGEFPVPGLLRRARRIADLSQRQLAVRARVPQSTVARVESGTLVPSLQTFQRLLDAAGLSLVVVDADGHVVQPMRECDDTRGGGRQRYPSHLDTILDPRPGEWWGDNYGLARPPETFRRNRAMRDRIRALSEYECRAHLHRHDSPPLPVWAWIRSEIIRAGWESRRRALWARTVVDSTTKWDDID